ncbi:MAG TPA: sarcosine oxidase subunit alpha family protein [Acetobacteraceae bacterium]|nr:sarcosine oxidase subunit alpha family protein [Acetobacteraceae bacterium]
MTGAFRTPVGGRIDRSKPLSFSFDGRRFVGCHGDTLASALLANGVHLVGRSFKYHRPRGILSAGAEEPNALVTLDRGEGRVTPNLRATQIELYDGLRARSQNCFPSLACDFGAVSNALAPLLSAGFYYKTFMWPRTFWRHVYEPAIRAAAGLGRVPTTPDADRYIHRYAHCDVLVVGAGAAGLAAAVAASTNGERVVLCDEQSEFGGSLHAESAPVDGVAASEWLEQALATLRQRAQVTMLPRTTAFGWFPDQLIGLAERVTDHLADPDHRLPRERLWHVRARRVVIATGAVERPLVFTGNDRPGIMLADAARIYCRRYGVKAGTRVVIATADDSAYAAGVALRAAGASVCAVADLRAEATDLARASGLPMLLGVGVANTTGTRRVSRVTLSNGESISCDLVLMCGGWIPSVHLYSQSRAKLRYDEAIGVFLPGAWTEQVRCAGACNGTLDVNACVQEGDAAGAGADAPARASVRTSIVVPPWTGGGKAFVDFQNDVTTKDLFIAASEGFRSIEHVKRYTTAGMATDQGKTANLNVMATVAALTHRNVPAVGHTTYRMPYTPVTFGALAGAARGGLFEPLRHTPMHDWAWAHGAVFENVGQWQRARWFARPGEDMERAVERECLTVRTEVGVFDASTLGKIEVTGPDAAEFLDRIYTGSFLRLAQGRCRYGLLLTEAGCVMDDGVVARLAPDRFHVTTTTGGAAHVLHHMEDYRQTEFPDLHVWLTSTTEQWAVIAVQGPSARQVIAPLADIDIAPAAMPHMSVRECHVCDVPARLFRVSFTGELGYEINVPSDYGPAVWEAVLAAGQAHGIAPYGTEAMHVLRAEKGYIVVGQETDGTVIPADVGLDWTIARAKRDFVGKRSLMLPDMQRPERKHLVGLLSSEVLEEGAQLVADHGNRSMGHVTSAYWSAALQQPIALALLSSGRARIGQNLTVPMQHGSTAVRVTDSVFYDRQGERLHG